MDGEKPIDPARVLDVSSQTANYLGIKPPIQVRRLADGYLLMDGLYRLRAAEAIHLEYIPAQVG